MASPRTTLAMLAAAAVLVAACGPAPDGTAAPSVLPPVASGGHVPASSDEPFVPAAWPATGSACGVAGYAGRIGLIEAPDAGTIRFTLCAPDGAFLARLAHPALGIVDAPALARLGADPSAARMLAGAGPYRITAWGTDNVRLERTAPSPGTDSAAPTVILRWAADPAARTSSLEAASVDGIDAPAASTLDELSTMPELSVVPRPGMSTAFLGFGRGAAFAGARVRAAVALGVDRGALAAAVFPAGSVAADRLAPCGVEGGCTGKPFPALNAAAGTAALQAAGFDLKATYPLHVPDAAIPGLPDPAGAAAALGAQLAASLGLRVAVDVMPAADFRAQVDAGAIDGLYLDGVASSLADASGFLEPLFPVASTSTVSRRVTGMANLLATAAAATDPAARDAALAAASDALRAVMPLVPLVHPASVTAFRADVTGVAVSPFGADPLGAMTAADRHQVVFLQATPPTGGWCGDQPSADAVRLCALVTEGLYGFKPGSSVAVPRLAEGCTPSPDATVWTCRLRRGVLAADGVTLDAGDVLATFRALWDATDPVHAAAPVGSFAAWDALFGGFLDAPSG